MSDVVDFIRGAGAAMLPLLSVGRAFHARDYLTSCQVRPGCHVALGAGPPAPWDACLDAPVLCWSMEDAMLAPYLFEAALSVTDDVAEYLGVDTPLLYSINAFCTRPSHDIRPDIQGWHRDADDVKFLPMFVYLTNVGDDGAQEIRHDDGNITRVTGPIGTSFFSNTMLEHRGLKPQHGERIVWWARWGVSERPASYEWDKLVPVSKDLMGDRYPADERLQRSIRLVCQ